MQAFEGITVLDMTHILAGPFSTYQLAVLGADVIKIEAPSDPDMNREIGPVDALNESLMGSHFQSQAANKRAMTLNLKTAEGQKIFRDLAAKADVIVENYRTGALEKLGLGYDDIKAINPRVIYCSITGFGQTGPKAAHGAFDNVIQAFSGMMMATGEPEGPGVLVGPPVLDYGTGAQAAFAIASALLRRERTGEGQRLDVAMLDSALMLMACFLTNYSATGDDPMRQGRNAGTFLPAYGCYDASDYQLMIGGCTPRQHARVWRAVGREDLANAVEGLRQTQLPQRLEEDKAQLAEVIRTKTASEWEEIFHAFGVPAARVRTLKEAVDSDQVRSRSVVGDFVSQDRGGAPLKAGVAGFMAAPDGPAVKSAPPELGQHTEEILAELGYTSEDIASLRDQQVV